MKQYGTKAVLFNKGPAFLLCFFFLLSCQSQQHSWKICRPKNPRSDFQSCKIYQKPGNIFREMEVEFVQTSSGLRIYLNILALQFTPSKNDPEKTEILIRTEEGEKTFLANRLAGNQRVLLSEDAQAYILNQIALNHTVTIFSGRFEAVIQPAELCRMSIFSWIREKAS